MSVLVKHGSTSLGVYLLGYRVYIQGRRLGVWLYYFGRDDWQGAPREGFNIGLLCYGLSVNGRDELHCIEDFYI